MAAIIIFVVASILCGISTNLTSFTLSRIMQGIGGALMVPVGRLVVLRDLPKEKLVKTVAIITWPALSAPILGPVLGGVDCHPLELAMDILYECAIRYIRAYCFRLFA